jgi:hypothetical protein
MRPGPTFSYLNPLFQSPGRGIEVEYVRNLIRKRNLHPDPLGRTLENWPWPLKIYTLGQFELIKDGKPIRFSRKIQQKPLSMLKALIAFGGIIVSVSQFTMDSVDCKIASSFSFAMSFL